MKDRKLNQWLWKWHFIAGLISLPFVLLLAITGAVYLFKPDVEKEVVATIQNIETTKEQTISYAKQFAIATETLKKKPNALILNSDKTKSTEFVSGRFSHKKSVFVNQYTGEVSGKFSPKDTWMYTVRKLHGELLSGKVGTKIIELIASWMVVLILTGLYIWWPFTKGLKGAFIVRFKEGKRTLFRDLHAVTGFWFSILLLVVLAGGFPWTDVFGNNFKWVQKVTNTGYPKTWSGRGLTSTIKNKTISIEEMITIGNQQNLPGTITLGLPKSPKSTFSISNKTFPLNTQKMLHFDQYSGKLIKEHTWSDVGILMRARMWLMAFHQGEFGGWNWWLMFFIAIGLTIITVAGLCSYLYRKAKGSWGVPKVSKQFSVGKIVILLLILLAIIFPLFGISLVMIVAYEQYKKRKLIKT